MTEKVKIDWLKGVRVLMIAHYIPGPMASYLLKNLGAEIIKVEPPFGDYMRQLPPFLEKGEKRMSTYFRSINAGFKSISINFKDESGVKVLEDLIKKSDVLIDGNRAFYLEKKVLKKKISDINPDLIHIPITAYGLKGPMRDLAGHNNNVLSLAANLSYTPLDEEGKPSVFGVQLADITSGYLAAIMALGAVMGRKNEKSSFHPNLIDASMIHSAFFLNQIYVGAMNTTDVIPKEKRELFNGVLPNYKMYKAKDGGSLFFGPIEINLFKNFCDAIEREDLYKLIKKDNKTLKKELKSLFLTKTLDEWDKLLEDVDCCYSRVNSLEEAVDNEQVKKLGLVSEIKDDTYGNLKLAGFPAKFMNEDLEIDTSEMAPELGEHSEQILLEILSYTDLEIEILKKNKTVIFYMN